MTIMEVPRYRQRVEPIGRSGGVFNPGVKIPMGISDYPAKAGELWAGVLDQGAKLSAMLGKQSDDTEAAKASNEFREHMDEFRQQVLYPDPKNKEPRGINKVSDEYIHGLSNKQRQVEWDFGLKVIQTHIKNKYGPKMYGRDGRATMGTSMANTLRENNSTFRKVVNKRIIQQAVAASLQKEEGLTILLSNPNITLENAKTYEQVFELQLKSDLRSGIQTGKQIHDRKEAFNRTVSTNLLHAVANQNLTSNGIFKRQWLKKLEENPRKALGWQSYSYKVWTRLKDEDRREIIDELRKIRSDGVIAANAEAKAKRQENEREALRVIAAIFDPEQRESMKVNVLTLKTMYQLAPDAISRTVYEQALEYSRTARFSRPGNEPAFLNIMSQIPMDITPSDTGDNKSKLVSSVTVQQIMAAGLSETQTTAALALLRTYKNNRYQAGLKAIINASGFVEGYTAELEQEQAQIITAVLSTYEAEFSTWWTRNQKATQAEIANKAAEITTDVRKQVETVFSITYEDKLDRFKRKGSNLALLTLVGDNIEILLFNKKRREEVIKYVMNNHKQFGLEALAVNNSWRTLAVRDLDLLRTLAIRVGKGPK